MSKRIHYHLIGIGGIGMSALARILFQRKAVISGSDVRDSGQLRALRDLGIQAFVGHSSRHIKALPRSAQIVYSSSIGPDHLERAAASDLKFGMHHRSDILIELAREKPTFGIAGSHGKSSTSALLAWLIGDIDKISFALGGILKSTDSNGQWSDHGPFIVEIDESDGRSFAISLTGGILTNISSEHLAHWKSLKLLCQGFATWAGALKDPNLFVFCADDSRCCKIAGNRGWSYGFAPFADYRIINLRRCGWSMLFDLCLPRARVWRDLLFPLFGAHQVLNAAAALAMSDLLQVKEGSLRERLSNFKGVARRGELKRSYRINTHQIAHFDDYAHHPNEVRAFLAGVRLAVGDQPLVALFQPHRFTRLRDCFEDYLRAFDRADYLWICPLYSAGERPIAGIDSANLVKNLNAHIAQNGGQKSGYLQSVELWPHSKNVLRARLANGGVVCTLGAGDIDEIDLSWLEDE